MNTNFIFDIIDKNIEKTSKIITRFPPEPNGYLHIGHAKSICLNFGIAQKYDGICNLRFDDTNPVKEEVEYIESIKEDINWLGFDVNQKIFFASDYFNYIFESAVKLIKKNKAYVCDLSSDEIRHTRGTLKDPGIESPFRNRSIEENLDLFFKMKNGKFQDGSHVLRAKIDMKSGNLNMRDPILYRIMNTYHHRTGNDWCIYPMYDFAHPISDALEHITYSICTLEFEDHRALYDWIIEELDFENKPRQIEFARLNLNYTVLSKRKLLELVNKKYVNGWNDPRMPTLSGMRRRGYPAESIKNFCQNIGIAKTHSIVDINFLEHCIREELNLKAKRFMAVLNPIKLIIDNYPENIVEEFDAVNHPENNLMGTRKVKFSKIIYIEREDFMENPIKKYFRLFIGNEVRLAYAYYVKCVSFKKNIDTGVIEEIHCTYDEKSRGAWTEDNRKVKGTIHWVSMHDSINAEIRLYDKLFLNENPENISYLDSNIENNDYLDNFNINSLEIIKNCLVEKNLLNIKLEDKIQFMRQGFFCLDKDSDLSSEKLIFNKIVSLKSNWQK